MGRKVTDREEDRREERPAALRRGPCDDDPEYILRLVGQVITVSFSTVRIVQGLPV